MLPAKLLAGVTPRRPVAALNLEDLSPQTPGERVCVLKLIVWTLCSMCLCVKSAVEYEISTNHCQKLVILHLIRCPVLNEFNKTELSSHVSHKLTRVACTGTSYVQVVRSRLQFSAWFSATLPTRSHSACRWSHFTTSTAVIIFVCPAGAGDATYHTWWPSVCRRRASYTLPDFITDCSSLCTLKQYLKTYLLSLSFWVHNNTLFCDCVNRSSSRLCCLQRFKIVRFTLHGGCCCRCC